MSFLQFLISEISQNTFIQFAATITIVVAAIVLLFRIRRKFFLNAGEVFFAKFSGVDCCFRTFFTFPGTKPFLQDRFSLGSFCDPENSFRRAGYPFVICCHCFIGDLRNFVWYFPLKIRCFGDLRTF